MAKSVLLAGWMLVLGFCGGLVLPINAHAGKGSPVVLELFTSQGCSSCPVADRILEKFAGDQDVIPLSFHVDYWDYIGWKDTFASKVTTARQYAYAKSLGERHVYTPQVIVQGKSHIVGSDEGRLRQAVRAAGKNPDRTSGSTSAPTAALSN